MTEPGQAAIVGFLVTVAGIVGNAIRLRAKNARALRAELAKADLVQIESKREHDRELIAEYKAQIAELRAESKSIKAELEQHRQERLVQDATIRELQAQLAFAVSRFNYAEAKASQLFDLNNRYRHELARDRAETKGTDPPSSPEASTGDLSGPTPIASRRPRK